MGSKTSISIHTPSPTRIIATASLLTGVLLLVGCPSPQVGFDSPAPTKRLDAIAQAGDADDRESLHRLIETLGSTDPAERMLAIRSLERREGTTLGFEHAAPQWERLEAITRWREHAGIAHPTDESGDDSGDGASTSLSDGHDDHTDSPMKTVHQDTEDAQP